MTTNKPEIACWGSFYKGVMQDFGYNEEATKSAAKLDFPGHELGIDPLIRLSDYERLQADNALLKQERDQLKVEVEALKPYRDNHHDFMRHMAEHDAEVIEKVASELKVEFPHHTGVFYWLIGLSNELRQKAQEKQT